MKLAGGFTSTTTMGLEAVRIGHDEGWRTSSVRGADVSVARASGAIIETSDDTAYHEACHVLAAVLLDITVHEATNIPGPGYGGYTSLAQYDTTVAAAAEAMGCDGTGHDMYTVEMHGGDHGTAVARARALLSGRKDDLLAIATAIEKKGTATGSQMAEHRERLARDLVLITFRLPDGTTMREYRTTQDDRVHLLIPDEPAFTKEQ